MAAYRCWLCGAHNTVLENAHRGWRCKNYAACRSRRKKKEKK